MKLVYPQDPPEIAHAEDVRLLVQACAKADLEIEPRDAALAWRDHSARNGAVWLGVKLTDEPRAQAYIVASIRKFCRVEGEENSLTSRPRRPGGP